MSWFVEPVACDYCVYELTNSGVRNLLVICNSHTNALTIADILNKDDKHESWKPTEEEETEDAFWRRIIGTESENK